MMDPQEKRALLAAHDTEIEMIRMWPHLSAAAIKRLVKAGSESLDYREHVITGAPLDTARMAQIAAYAKASEIGVLIHQSAQPEPESDTVTAEQLERMSPAERINYARRKKK